MLKKEILFYCTKLFKKKVPNNSREWSFKKYLKYKDYPSTPFRKEINENSIIRFTLEKGDVLCFSGNHIHGSILGEKNRVNLETRTICSTDEKKFIIPQNIDSYLKKKKKQLVFAVS